MKNPRVIDLQNETTTMQIFLVVYYVWLQICIIIVENWSNLRPWLVTPCHDNYHTTPNV